MIRFRRGRGSPAFVLAGFTVWEPLAMQISVGATRTTGRATQAQCRALMKPDTSDTVAAAATTTIVAGSTGPRIFRIPTGRFENVFASPVFSFFRHCERFGNDDDVNSYTPRRCAQTERENVTLLRAQRGLKRIRPGRWRWRPSDGSINLSDLVAVAIVWRRWETARSALLFTGSHKIMYTRALEIPKPFLARLFSFSLYPH